MDSSKLTGEYKIVLLIVAGSFFISMLIGFLVKNPAGIIIMRAFLSSLLFGALIYGGWLIIKKFIPNFGTTMNAGGGNEEEALPDSGPPPAIDVGSVVDYTVGEDEGGFQEEQVNIPSVDGLDGKEEEGATAAMEAVEMTKEVPLTEENRGFPTPEDEGNQLEELPSIESLFNEEEGAKPNPNYETQDETINTGSPYTDDYINVGNAQIPNEPEVMAKAIKKVMKQDESTRNSR
jgi:hypothetical protein